MGKGERRAVKFRSPQQLDQLAEALLAEHGVTEPPVPVEQIASDLGLTVEYTELGDEVSGLLVMSGETGTIGVNKNHPVVRQRFTIAHEIAHYRLHTDWSDVFIDKDYEPRFRDNKAQRGEHPEEIQANGFAAALLMPASLLRDSIEAERIDIGDDDRIHELATRFQVSVSALTYRMTNLDILK